MSQEKVLKYFLLSMPVAALVVAIFFYRVDTQLHLRGRTGNLNFQSPSTASISTNADSGFFSVERFDSIQFRELDTLIRDTSSVFASMRTATLEFEDLSIKPQSNVRVQFENKLMKLSFSGSRIDATLHLTDLRDLSVKNELDSAPFFYSDGVVPFETVTLNGQNGEFGYQMSMLFDPSFIVLAEDFNDSRFTFNYEQGNTDNSLVHLLAKVPRLDTITFEKVSSYELEFEQVKSLQFRCHEGVVHFKVTGVASAIMINDELYRDTFYQSYLLDKPLNQFLGFLAFFVAIIMPFIIQQYIDRRRLNRIPPPDIGS